MRLADMKKQSSESLLKYTVDTLNKSEIINHLITTHSHINYSLNYLLELMIEKKISLVKSQELDATRNQITELKRKCKITSTFSQGLYKYT